MILLATADSRQLPLPDDAADICITSPYYLGQRAYGRDDIACDLDEWIERMIVFVREAVRVTKGVVIFVCSGVGGLNYLPAPEGLLYRAHKEGIPTPRPDYWGANKPPSGKKWLSNTMEYCLAFGTPHYFNPESLATPMKYRNGGAFRQRGKDGLRKAGSSYPTHTVRKTVPNYFYVPVGGGRMGHPLACRNEAPFPVGVPERFIKLFCPPGGTVLDIFGGSHSTGQAARECGMDYIGIDLRHEQNVLGKERLKTRWERALELIQAGDDCPAMA
jgi:hypothetical protein